MTGADFRHALTESLLGRSDDELVALLAARPDLASPAPSTLVALAARAAARTSVERALATLDAAALAVAEAVVALAPLADGTAPPGDGATPPGDGAAGVDRLARATGLPTDTVADARDHLESLALLVDGRPVVALTEALGPFPTGLGPPLTDLTGKNDLAGRDGAPGLPAMLACGAITFLLRAGSLHWGWRLPVYKPRPPVRPHR